MDLRVIETVFAVVSFFILRFATIKFLAKIQNKYNYSKYRIRPILKFIKLFIFMMLLIVIIAIWGVEQSKILTFITSVLTVVGIALFAEWSILSNVSSALILFVSHPIKLGESITILDKEFEVKGQVSDIGLFYVILRTASNEKLRFQTIYFYKEQQR